MIKLICVGKVREKRLDIFIQDYINRINRLDKIEVVEVKSETAAAVSEVLNGEGEKILNNVGEQDFVVLCDINGMEYSSEELASYLKSKMVERKIVFVVGGAYGVSEKVKGRADLLLSFSKMTFPHEFFRLFLVEQIYRVISINKGMPYHK